MFLGKIVKGLFQKKRLGGLGGKGTHHSAAIKVSQFSAELGEHASVDAGWTGAEVVHFALADHDDVSEWREREGRGGSMGERMVRRSMAR